MAYMARHGLTRARPAELDIHFNVNLDGSRDVRLCAHSELGEDLIA